MPPPLFFQVLFTILVLSLVATLVSAFAAFNCVFVNVNESLCVFIHEDFDLLFQFFFLGVISGTCGF